MTEDAGLSSRKSSHFWQLSAEPRKYTPMLIKCRYGANKCHYSRDSWVLPAVRCRSLVWCSSVCVCIGAPRNAQADPDRKCPGESDRAYMGSSVQPESPGRDFTHAYGVNFRFPVGCRSGNPMDRSGVVYLSGRVSPMQLSTG